MPNPTLAQVEARAVRPPKNRAELLAAVADPEREFGLLATAGSTLAAPAFNALETACKARGVSLPTMWPSHERGKCVPQGCYIIMVRQ